MAETVNVERPFPPTSHGSSYPVLYLRGNVYSVVNGGNPCVWEGHNFVRDEFVEYKGERDMPFVVWTEKDAVLADDALGSESIKDHNTLAEKFLVYMAGYDEKLVTDKHIWGDVIISFREIESGKPGCLAHQTVELLECYLKSVADGGYFLEGFERILQGEIKKREDEKKKKEMVACEEKKKKEEEIKKEMTYHEEEAIEKREDEKKKKEEEKGEKEKAPESKAQQEEGKEQLEKVKIGQIQIQWNKIDAVEAIIQARRAREAAGDDGMIATVLKEHEVRLNEAEAKEKAWKCEKQQREERTPEKKAQGEQAGVEIGLQLTRTPSPVEKPKHGRAAKKKKREVKAGKPETDHYLRKRKKNLLVELYGSDTSPSKRRKTRETV